MKQRKFDRESFLASSTTTTSVENPDPMTTV